MSKTPGATPLFALDPVALDTETTGLDPRTARVVEIGAVGILGSRLDPDRSLRTLVALDQPIPEAASAVHGIKNADLAGAPGFPQAYEALESFVDGRIVIGHAIGYDIAMIRRECALHGLACAQWRTLDTRLLAQVVNPELASFSIEALCAWLGIAVEGRHEALGDARLAALIFIALLPRLRERGVRTFGDATEACRALTEALDPYDQANWTQTPTYPAPRERAAHGRRLDAYPYRHRARQIMSAPPAFVAPGEPLREGLARMAERKISSLFVGAPDEPAASLGIVTERDVLRAVHERGAAALELPIADIASRPLIGVPEDAFVYRAIARMSRRGLRHLAVLSPQERVVGALSARDLLRLRAVTAIELGDDIDEAPDVAALARAWAKVPAMAASLIEEEVGARDIAGVVARELGALARRAAILAEEELAAAGRGAPPCAYALLVLGSAGRGESLLALDQDHAIVFAQGEPGGETDLWFEALGKRVSDILDEIGVPYCPGGVMSGNAAFRGSLGVWRERVARWIARGSPQDLLNVDIFYDFRFVHGEAELAAVLWSDAWKAAEGARSFIAALAQTGAERETAFGFFGRLRAEEGRIDLKRHGLRGLVGSARLLALRHGVALRATPDRLAGVRALHVGGAADLEAAEAAFARILGLILRAQVADIGAGRPATNKVPLALAQAHGGLDALKDDLRRVEDLEQLAQDQIAS